MEKIDLDRLVTEKRNKATMDLDKLSIHQAAIIMNKEDQKVAIAVKEALPWIEIAINKVVASFQNGGRLIYIGAGTSGRLGVLDAAECVPTFGVEPEMVTGLIAGGQKALTVAVEGAEDDADQGIEDLKRSELSKNDTVVGIAASGRTPYVAGALEYAKKVGAGTVALSLNKDSVIGKLADTKIEVDVGPEFLTGSTRLKSGTAQKMVLNMISTISMIRIGKVYKNLMVDVKPTNGKLIERAKHIIMEATDSTYQTASEKFKEADNDVKTAIVMILTDCDKKTAKQKILKAHGFVRKTL